MPAFQRATPPIIFAVTTSATRQDIPAGFFTTPPGMNAQSVWIMNPNLFWVRLAAGSGAYNAVTDWNGANPGSLLPPGFFGAFSTTYPDWLSSLSVEQQGLAAGTGRIEFSYGGGE